MQLDDDTEKDGSRFFCSLHRPQVNTFSYLLLQGYCGCYSTNKEKPAVALRAGLAIGVFIATVFEENVEVLS